MPPPKTEQKPLQAVEQITPYQLEFKLKGILEEYLKDCCTVARCDKDIRECIPASSLSQLRSLGYDKIVEESTRARIRTATLFAQFIRLNMLPLESYCAGLEDVLELVDDLTIENPKIWEYLAEMVAPLIYENTLSLERLRASCVLISQGNAGKFLGPILKLVVGKKGPNYLASLWHSSKLILEDFLPIDDMAKFITDNQLEFLVDGLSTSDSESVLTFKQIREKLLDFFENKNSIDDVSNWITVNVGDRVKDKPFIRVLATAVFENSIVGLKLNDEILRNHYKILLQYIGGNFEFEVQLLYALQAHINKLGDPQGLLLKVFMILYEDLMISHDSIIYWESNKDPAEQNVIHQCSPYNTTGKKVFDNKDSGVDVKLHKCKNPWRPARFTAYVAATEDEKTEQLYKKLQCILNKLTPHKFDILLHQIKLLSVDTLERLQGVTDLVHKQAVNDAIFTVGYAIICSRLALMQVPTNKKEGEYVNFRKLLITRCQLEFEKNSVGETSRNEKIKEIEACTDPEKKMEMELILEEDDRRFRRKSVGNVRFIGELFKKQMVAIDTIMTCLDKLLNNKDNGSLECLSTLLSTVGEELEKREVSLEHIFDTIKEIVDHKPGKIDNRVRFILQDVIELRSAKWVPRHQDSNANKASDEQLNNHRMNADIEQRNNFNSVNILPIFQMQSTAPYMQVQPVHPMYCMPYYGNTLRPTLQHFYQGQYPTALPYPQAPPPAQGYRYLIPQPTSAKAASINPNPRQQVSQNFYQGQTLLQGQGFHYFMPRPQTPVGSVLQPRVQHRPPQFLVDGVGTSAPSFEQIHKTLLHFFSYNNFVDDIYNWINVNVGDRVKDKQFIRVLATAVLENSIVQSKLNSTILRKHYKLLLKYIDGNLEYELQLLYAVQAHINKLQNSKGLLLDVFTILYDDSIISQDSFVRWESSKDPTEREGKRVALKQLTSFFMSLKAEDEDSLSFEDF